MKLPGKPGNTKHHKPHHLPQIPLDILTRLTALQFAKAAHHLGHFALQCYVETCRCLKVVTDCDYRFDLEDIEPVGQLVAESWFDRYSGGTSKGVKGAATSDSADTPTMAIV